MKKELEKILDNIRNLTEDEFQLLIEDAVEETLIAKNKKGLVIKASELKVGFQLAESDGYLFDVIEIIKETQKTITVRLAQDTSMTKSFWTCNGGILKTFRKNTLLHGVF